jgi:UrcA family protein
MTMNRSNTTRFFAVSNVAVCLALAVANIAPALADGTDTVRQRSSQVSFADLDLSRPTDVAVARERVHQMARALCTRVADPQSLAHQPAFVSCVDTAMAKAEPGIQKLAAAAAAGNPQRVAELQH